MDPQEKEHFFAQQFEAATKTFPVNSEEVRVAKRNYERAQKELLDSECTQ